MNLHICLQNAQINLHTAHKINYDMMQLIPQLYLFCNSYSLKQRICLILLLQHLYHLSLSDMINWSTGFFCLNSQNKSLLNHVYTDGLTKEGHATVF